MTYAFSNYGSYERLTQDGLTEWHPAFLGLGETLEACAQRYREFCRRYSPKRKKTTPRQSWGSRFLELPSPGGRAQGFNKKPAGTTDSGQMSLPLGVYQVDPLGSWFGSKAAQVFIAANGAAAWS